MVDIWAVVLTHNRAEQYAELVNDLVHDIRRDHIVIVDHKSDPPAVEYDGTHFIRDDGPANIQRLWNIGLDIVDRQAWHNGGYHVAVLNDDLRIPKGTLPALSDALTYHKGTIAYPDQSRSLKKGHNSVERRRGPYNLHYRMSGYCWMLNGDAGLRLDEKLVWWYGDDDIEWRAAELGGTVRVGGTYVEHLSPNGSTNSDPDLAKQTGIDRATFIAKWGKPPW